MKNTLCALLLLGWLVAGLGCASRVKSVAPQEQVEMAAIVGTLLDEKFREERFYFADKPGHDTWWSTEIELAVESPAELAGSRRRFSMPLGWPVSYTIWKGKRVRLTLPRAVLADVAAQPSAMVQLQSPARLEAESGNR